MHLDKWYREIQEGDYAMLLDTSWKSNNIRIIFVLVTRLTEKRLYYVVPHLWIRGWIQETWCASNKLIVINKETFIEGVVNSEFRTLPQTRTLTLEEKRQLMEETLELIENRQHEI